MPDLRSPRSGVQIVSVEDRDRYKNIEENVRKLTPKIKPNLDRSTDCPKCQQVSRTIQIAKYKPALFPLKPEDFLLPLPRPYILVNCPGSLPASTHSQDHSGCSGGHIPSGKDPPFGGLSRGLIGDDVSVSACFQARGCGGNQWIGTVSDGDYNSINRNAEVRPLNGHRSSST